MNPSLFKPEPKSESEPGELLDGPLRYFADTSWTCETFGGSKETHVYKRTDGGFVLHNVLQTPTGQTFNLDETYAFDFKRRVWNVRQSDGVYVAKSVLSTDTFLIFEGNEMERGAPTLVRMRYHMYDDVYFRRDFETLRDGRWIPYSGETCERSAFRTSSAARDDGKQARTS